MKKLLGVLVVLVLVFSLVASSSPVHAATFTVTNTTDGGLGSLRQAIVDANANSGTDTINFDIPGPGPHTIQPLSALPTITDAVIIDGASQPGWQDAPIVELDGTPTGPMDGLTIAANDSTVKGLVINRFGGNGISIRGDGNTVSGNYIGTDANGTTPLPNVGGMWIGDGASNNTIGGATGGERNVISGNLGEGLTLFGNGTSGNVVSGNHIGTDAGGTSALPNIYNGVWISDGASNNTIGGATAGAGNIISGNDAAGIAIAGSGNWAHVRAITA